MVTVSRRKINRVGWLNNCFCMAVRILRGLLLIPFILSFECMAQNGLVYSHIFPSLGNQSAITAMVTDAAGNVYLTGWTEELAVPVTPGAVLPTAGGTCTYGSGNGNPFSTPQTFPCPNAFVIKLNAHGGIVFATYVGGFGFTQATAIGVDAAGNVYVAGIDAVHPTFIIKLNPTGTAVLYTATLPGTGPTTLMMPFGANVPLSDVIISMAVDSAGNAYFATKGAAGFPVTANAIQANGGIAIGKLDPTGKIIYATYLGGANDYPGGVTVDASGDLYITGATSATDFPVSNGVLQSTLVPGSSDAFVVKLNPSGGLAYATYLGAGSGAIGNIVRVDSAGEAYVLGTSRTGFPVTAGAYQPAYNASPAFLAKLNPSATALVYATYVSGNTNSFPPSLLDVDAAGDAYISGPAWPGFQTSADALQPCIPGLASPFVLQLSPLGRFVAATFLGDSVGAVPYALEAQGNGTVLLAGLAAAPDFFVTPDSSLSPPGEFVAKFQIADATNVSLPCSILAPVNEATFQGGPVAPGELVTFWGLRFGPDAGSGMQLDSSGRIATELAGVRVFFNSIPAPLLYVQAQQINVQVPWELDGQPNAQVHVEYNGVSTPTGTVQLQPSAPALFAVVINQDGTRNSPTNPAPAGSAVSIYGTGGGPTNPPSITGGFAPAKNPPVLQLPASVLLDGTLNADVLYAGDAPTFISGLFQVNFRVPASLGAFATHRVDVQIGTASTESRISITIATSNN